MFLVGDKIFYPMHGAGHIEAIELRGDDNKTSYYCLYFYGDGLKIMVPTDKAQEVGMRPVISKQEVESVFLELSRPPGLEENNWNRRYRANLDKLRLGTPWSIAQVLSALYARNQIRGLSASEKKILASARKFIVGELLLAGAGEEKDINDRIDYFLSFATDNDEAPKKANIV